MATIRRSLSSSLSFTFLLAFLLSFFVPNASAEYIIESKSLNPCMANSGLTASLFNVALTPNNASVGFKIKGISTITGNVTIEFRVLAYGIKITTQQLKPCDLKDLKGMCPMNTGELDIESSFPISADVIKSIPSIAYTVPDLDGTVQVIINRTSTREQLACVEAELSNGKTVYQKAVGFATAIIAGLGLLASAITNGLGHSNTAAHVAANAMSLFGFFQTQAYYGMMAVDLPPIAAAWTQNFQWTMGIIRVGFLQRMATWYQRATGGTPTSFLSSLGSKSVSVQKRSLDILEAAAVPVARHLLYSRSNNDEAKTTKTIVVRGIERVGFKAKIEISNIFLTGYIFFIIFVLLVVLTVGLAKVICDLLVKHNKLKSDQFQDFRNGWLTVLKGIMFRIILIGFSQMVVLCFWELTRRDSSAEVVLAIFTLVTMICILGWAASKVIRIAQRSINLHKNPAYILYSDPISLNKWGFLYVQYKATAYYFVLPMLVYIMIRGMFIGLAQKNGTVQAVALLLIEAAMLITICVMRPFMDKKTNGFNIAICAVNFLSSIFLLFFSNVFNQPAIVTGIIGVVFFALNAIFALVLLLMVLVSSTIALVSKNPENRYQPMRDDRGSFIKSQTQLTTELDALGATARGESKTGFHGKRSTIDDDDEFNSYANKELNNGPSANPTTTRPFGEPPRSPIDPHLPLFPGSTTDVRPNSFRSNTSSPAPGAYYGQQARRNDAFRQQNNASPWQRGAGYEH